MPGKPSRSQRDERRATLKLLAFGGATAVLLGAGAITAVRLMPPATVAGGKTLGTMLLEGDLLGNIHYLRGAGTPDVVVVGSSDCGFCRTFVAEGLETLLGFAESEDVVVAYLALPTGPGSMASTQALDCLKGSSDPAAALRATYALSKEVTEGLAPGLVPDRMQAIMGEFGVEGSASACWSGLQSETIAARGQRIARALNVQGTPSFYVASRANPSEVRVFSGFGGASALERQMKKNRE